MRGAAQDNLQNALDTFNEFLGAVFRTLTQSPEEFRGGSIWDVITDIHAAIQAIALGLLVMFFLAGVVKACGEFNNIKRPEQMFKLFLRFVLAKAAITYGLELLLALLSVAQGLISTIISSSEMTDEYGIGLATVPDEVMNAISNIGWWNSFGVWAVTLIGGLVIIVLSFIMLFQVYGRFFKIYMYIAISPIPLSTFAGEPSSGTGKAFIKSFCAVCLEGAIIILAMVIFSAFAAAPPAVNVDASASIIVWRYIIETTFNLLVLVGTIKMSDNVVRQMMGL